MLGSPLPRSLALWTTLVVSLGLLAIYNHSLMQAILYDRCTVAKNVGVELISLDDAPRGYAEFDAGAAKKYVIDPHNYTGQV